MPTTAKKRMAKRTPSIVVLGCSSKTDGYRTTNPVFLYFSRSYYLIRAPSYGFGLFKANLQLIDCCINLSTVYLIDNFTCLRNQIESKKYDDWIVSVLRDCLQFILKCYSNDNGNLVLTVCRGNRW